MDRMVRVDPMTRVELVAPVDGRRGMVARARRRILAAAWW